MSELALVAPLPRAELVGLLRARIGHAVPGARLLAEGILGEGGRIDLVAVDPAGGVVLVLVGEPGQDLELVARALAQRAWVEARLGDWAQLAPDLGLRSDTRARVCLLCPSFGAEATAAARALGPQVVRLVRTRCVRGESGEVQVLLEHEGFDDIPDAPPEPTPPSGPAFRTGLTDADLGLDDEEHAAFEGTTPGGPAGDTLRHR